MVDSQNLEKYDLSQMILGNNAPESLEDAELTSNIGLTEINGTNGKGNQSG